MTFYVVVRHGGEKAFETIEDANERADKLRNRGVECWVEARDV